MGLKETEEPVKGAWLRRLVHYTQDPPQNGKLYRKKRQMTERGWIMELLRTEYSVSK
jgi:hypothetical protein